MTIETTARNATLTDLAAMLQRQQDVKLDAVVSAPSIRSINGVLHVDGMSALGDTLMFRPTEICDSHLADKLGIPLAYIRRLREERPDLYDANVNGWMLGEGIVQIPEDDRMYVDSLRQPDLRSFLLRTFSDPDGGEGIARALHSDRYAVVDNLDVLMAALAGVQQAGAQTELVDADLSERRMTVRFTCPSIQALAPTLLAGYRSPYSGNTGDENPTVFAGFELSNSETGGGAFSITPRLVVQICTNGMKLTKDAIRKVHLGGRMEEGIVRYSDETKRKQLELVTAEAADTVSTFLDVEYVKSAIIRLEEAAGHPVGDPVKAVELVAKRLAYTEAEQASILGYFVNGGQSTAGGVMQAITAAAQDKDMHPDRAFELESSAVTAMELLAAA